MKLSPRVCIRDPHFAKASIAPQPTSRRLLFVSPNTKGDETGGEDDVVVKWWTIARINEGELKSKNFPAEGRAKLNLFVNF